MYSTYLIVGVYINEETLEYKTITREIVARTATEAEKLIDSFSHYTLVEVLEVEELD